MITTPQIVGAILITVAAGLIFDVIRARLEYRRLEKLYPPKEEPCAVIGCALAGHYEHQVEEDDALRYRMTGLEPVRPGDYVYLCGMHWREAGD